MSLINQIRTKECSQADQIYQYYLPEGRTGFLLKKLEDENEIKQKDELKSLFKEQIKILTSSIQEVEFSYQSNQSHFPIQVNLVTGERIYTNEFCWARGDLPVLLLLYKADEFFGEVHNKFIADTVGQVIAKRKNVEEVNRNPFIRHGTSGIALSFLKLFELSGKFFYKNAYEYWIEKTQLLGSENFKEENPDSLLDNYQGVNAVLNKGKMDWRSFFY
ncbi:hypothetical protein VB776_21580 [Arcicella sp. DC2W]|uniref:Uncharacterized protein n=1 Tax=Arcicella gelida TaxID=2984195 RepID=A0ABU5SAN7_9BACT|nr:hypothetical protein [Arcicella sp. DC2W]MEA5405546.1 hypothetical protein [Arcicella sp. DC2W]